MNDRHPGRRTDPIGNRHNPRDYANLKLRFGLTGRCNRHSASSRLDRIHNWF